MVEALAQWIAEEYDNKRQLEVDTSGWPRRYERSIPRQQNGWDCGVFALQARDPFRRHELLHRSVWFPGFRMSLSLLLRLSTLRMRHCMSRSLFKQQARDTSCGVLLAATMQPLRRSWLVSVAAPPRSRLD